VDNPIAVSTWTLHREVTARGLEDVLLDLALLGMERVEICHFHLKEQTTIPDGLTVQSFLIDEGDLTGDDWPKWMDWIREQILVAKSLNARHARVIAGKTTGPEKVIQSAERMLDLAEFAAEHGIRITVENWFDLLGNPESMIQFLDLVGPKIGFNIDLGNWPTPQKYEWLPQVFDRAELCHAKCEFLPSGEVDMDDYGRCLQMAIEASYDGPLTIVNGGSNNEWDAIRKTVAAIRGFH
jgi:sugar phosphate isomerase/epimerase